MKVHHIGYLVKNMELAIKELQSIGYSLNNQPIHDSNRGGYIAFLKNYTSVIELIAPDEECKEYRSLQKRIGNGPYHVCYISDNFDADIERLESLGWLMIKQPKEAIAIGGKKVAFFFSEALGIIELIE